MSPAQELALRRAVEKHLPDLKLDSAALRTGVPAAAKDETRLAAIRQAVREIPTEHLLVRGDARDMREVADESVHFVLTSPPYWTLKEYNGAEGQLGHIEDYEGFLDELDRVWYECWRCLVPGGRMAIVVGDVCLSRRKFGRHVVFPLHASIQERCRKIGFDNLSPIIWHKIANIRLEVENGSSFLGKPYEPNGIIKNDIEYILLLRKPGSYRRPTAEMRALSLIGEAEHREWFRQIWTIPGASTRNHPAPYPLELAVRLVRMFSFVGDTVLDPFSGTGTTSLASAECGRNSIGYEIDEAYFRFAEDRLTGRFQDLFGRAVLNTILT